MQRKSGRKHWESSHYTEGLGHGEQIREEIIPDDAFDTNVLDDLRTVQMADLLGVQGAAKGSDAGLPTFFDECVRGLHGNHKAEVKHYLMTPESFRVGRMLTVEALVF